MEPDGDLHPDTDDLPLQANTNHILVRHYVLDLTVHFDKKIIGGSIVMFLEPCSAGGTKADNDIEPGAGDIGTKFQDFGAMEGGTTDLRNPEMGKEEMFDKAELQPECGSQSESDNRNIQVSQLWQNTGDFTLVLDCCDLDVSKVEEVDIISVLDHLPDVSESVSPQEAFIQKLFSTHSEQWSRKHRLFSLCSRAPDGGSLQFYRDRWSLQVRKMGVKTPQEFPRVIRICYRTRPSGGSVRWTKDQDRRFVSGCVQITVESFLNILENIIIHYCMHKIKSPSKLFSSVLSEGLLVLPVCVFAVTFEQ